jgi:probable phosphoglycerate mutase
MKLILTRHGRTIENNKKILQGHMPGKLTAEGIAQAKKLAKRLRDEKIDVIYSSDLKRAADTTKEIRKFHKGVPVFFVEELRERNLGSLQGMQTNRVNWKKIPKDVETLLAMKKRMAGFLDKVYKQHKDEIVIFVTHGGIGRSLLTVIERKPAKSIFEIPKMKNTGVYVIEILENKKPKILLANCTKHL